MNGRAAALLSAAAAPAAALVLAFAPAVAWSASPLLEAVKSRDTDTAMELARQRGVDVNAVEADGSTALLWAAHYEDEDLVRELIRRRADVNRANDYGVAPMQLAAAAGNAEIIRMLLRAGADVESPNPEGQTALMAVARTGNLEAARLLIRAGADVNAAEEWGGQTALMWAAAQHHPDMIRLLIEAGANADAQAAVRDWERRLTSEPRIKELFSGGFTPLLYAAREGCVECVRALIEAGANPDKSDPDGVTPLLAALLNFRFDTAAYLVEAGADPNKWDWWGRTPLYAAADMNITPQGARADLPSTDLTTGVDVARMLLERGADPNLRLKNVPPPRNIVFDRGVDDGVLNTGATPLLRAAYGADLEMLELLMAHGARPDIPNANGTTPVFAVAGPGGTRAPDKNQRDIVAALEIMAAHGVDVNEAGAGGQTPLMASIRRNYLDVVAWLADHGADLQAVDTRGRTPRDYAIGRADQLGFGGNNVVGLLPEMADLVEAKMREQGLEVGPRLPPLTTEELIAAGRGQATAGLSQ